MSKIVFADGSEMNVNNASSIYAITFDTVDKTEVSNIVKKFTIENLTSIKIVNEDGDVTSEGKDFISQGIMPRTDAEIQTEGEATSTTIVCRPMSQSEKALYSMSVNNEAMAAAVQELAEMMA